jgi:hypothetical protein
MIKTRPGLSTLALVSVLLCAPAFAAEATIDTLLPLKPEVRKVLNQSCVMCHGEVIDGKAEIREDLDLSTDDAIRETLSEPGRLKEMIANDEMPHEAKLSFRLRRNPQMQERLTKLKADYDANGEKEILLAWLKDVTATVTPKDEK